MKKTTRKQLGRVAAYILIVGIAFGVWYLTGPKTAVLCEIGFCGAWVLGRTDGRLHEQIQDGIDTLYFFCKSAQYRGEEQSAETKAWLTKQDGKSHRYGPPLRPIDSSLTL